MVDPASGESVRSRLIAAEVSHAGYGVPAALGSELAVARDKVVAELGN
jgi:thiamine pyrophosphate-dependent acetolactate synthase large subunit-like protein